MEEIYVNSIKFYEIALTELAIILYDDDTLLRDFSFYLIGLNKLYSPIQSNMCYAGLGERLKS